MASFRKVGRNWFFRFIDADGVQRERRGCPDRRATEEMARAAESGGVWFWLRSFVILASEGVISTSSLFRNPYDQGGSACTPSSTSVARMPNAPMRASEAGETSPSVAGAARATASAGPPAAPARPASLEQARLPDAMALDVLNPIREGCGTRATGRLVGVDKNTVTRYVARAGAHAEPLHQELVACSPHDR